MTETASGQIHITTHETWQDDTVRVDQNIIIDDGASLTIRPGTVVLFVDQNFIDVYGELNVNGTEGDSVVMTAVDSTWQLYDSRRLYDGWGGIYVYNNGSMKAGYTVFEKLGYAHHSKDGYAVFGTLRNESSHAMEFDHCRFAFKRDREQTSEGCNMESAEADIIIRNSVFKNNIGRGSLIELSNGGSLTMSNTTLSDNDVYGFIISGPDAFLNIHECRFENNKARALIYGITYEGNTAIEQNIFLNNVGFISLQGVYSAIYFRNNLYKNNGGQVYFWLGSDIITGNVFQDNYYVVPYDLPMNNYEAIVRIENGGAVIFNNSFINNRAVALDMWSTESFDIENNIFHNNYPSHTSLHVDPETLNTNGRIFQYNIIDPIIAGPGNLGSNPRLDAQYGFLLSPNSPAVDKGNQNIGNLLSTDLLGNPRTVRQVDIGAIEFQESYIPLTSIYISTSAVSAANFGQAFASLYTTSEFAVDEITYTLPEENGINNDYFSLEGNQVILKKALTAETLLRIKVRATHVSGAWMEDYFYFNVLPIVTAIESPETAAGKVFPIPADKFLYVNESRPGISYSVFSISGIQIQSGYLTQGAIDVSSLADGMYILQLVSSDKTDRIKFHKRSQ